MAELIVRIVLANPKAVRALRVVAECLDESSDAMEWRPELKRAAKAAKYLMRNLTVQAE